MEYSEDLERIIESDDADNGWVDTHHYEGNTSSVEDKISEMTLENTKGESMEDAMKNSEENDDDDDDDDEEAADMEAFEESGMLEDDQVIIKHQFIAILINNSHFRWQKLYNQLM